MKILDNILNRKLYAAYKEVFDSESPSVQIVLKDLCEAHGVFDGGFDPNPQKNAFNSGERNVVLRILSIINMKSNDIIKLAEEDKNE